MRSTTSLSLPMSFGASQGREVVANIKPSDSAYEEGRGVVANIKRSDSVYEVLRNVDLLKNIFQHFDVDLDTEEGEPAPKKFLLWAALSSRSFVDPALDVLWRTMHSLKPFYALFPSLTKPYGMSVQVLHGPPLSDTDWTRFVRYAHRLRVLKLDKRDTSDISSAILHYLDRSLSPVFPNLRHICYSSYSSLSTEVFLLLSPSLQSFELKNITKESDIMVILLYALASMHRLQSLSLDGALTGLSVQSIKPLTDLRSLSLTNMGQTIDDTVINWISGLTRLTQLTLDLQNSHVTSIPNSFDTLLVLNVTGSISLILMSLSAIRSATLEDVTMKVLTGDSTRATSAEWMSLVDAVKAKWLTSLRGFTLEDHRALQYTLSLPDVFGALFQANKLERFEITQFKSTLDLTNAHCRQIAVSWRMLRVLHIKVPARNIGQLSIDSLIDLVNYCPHLKSLALYVDFQAMPPHPPHHNTSSHGLESLSLGGSAVGDKLAIARRLDNLFPQLKRLGSILPNIDVAKSWEQVKTYVWAFKAVRADERARVEKLYR